MAFKAQHVLTLYRNFKHNYIVVHTDLKRAMSSPVVTFQCNFVNDMIFTSCENLI